MGKAAGMDDHFAHALLTLRRFIGVPLPATDWRIRAVLRPDPDRIRVRLVDSLGRAVTVDLPTRHGREQGTWWYAGALRHTATWLTQDTMPPPGEDGLPYLDVSTLLGTVVSEPAETTLDDGIDYLIADLAGDPLWQGAQPSIDPALYVLAGFDHHHPDTVRVYLDHDARTIGIDLSVRSETGAPRTVGWWAATKLIALLRPEDIATLAAHRVHGVTDPLCDAVYDLTNWA
ncbi:hypothetical protein [Streptomyces sp. NPDC058623]|uniref:hypothetical protein n=1 Tax=Streptomyces sp. NPDC058623 TaxID=3346563 RepID=UPI0036612477